MTRALRSLAIAAAATLLVPVLARAQFQTCVFCDVQAFTPDPLVVTACSSGTQIINGIGYQSPGINGCSRTPVVEVRSTRPDRVTITAFRVLADTRISFDWTAPCNATEGLVGIDVTIDDDSGDTIVPYACGNNRMRVVGICGNRVLDAAETCDDGNTADGDGCSSTCQIEQAQLAVQYESYRADWTSAGVRVRWRTILEEDTNGFEVWGRDGAQDVVVRQFVDARGSGASYNFIDASPLALARVVGSYRIVEITSSGPGNATEWFPVRHTQLGNAPATVHPAGGTSLPPVGSGGAVEP